MSVTDQVVVEVFSAAFQERGTGQIQDYFGGARFEVAVPVDLDWLSELSRRQGVRVDVFVGDDAKPVRFSDETPSESDRTAVRSLLSVVATDVTAADAARSGYDLVDLVSDRIQGARVSLQRPGWVRSVLALERAIENDWRGVASTMRGLGEIVVGEQRFTVRSWEVVPGRSVPYLDDQAPDGDELAWLQLRQVCDAEAWRALGIQEQNWQDGLRVALHHDQEPVVEIHPRSASGGLDLLRWVYETDDANRLEALRHVLRSATVSGVPRLPDARAVRRLSEQQRIALARDNAAAIQQAVTEAHRDTTAALRDAMDGLAEVTDTAVKTVNATVVAALGIVAVVGRASNGISTPLIWLVAGSVIVGLLAATFGSWRRVGDYRDQVRDVRRRIEDDPLTPDVDKADAVTRIGDFGAAKRSKTTRATIAVLALLGCVVVVAAAFALGSASVDPSDVETARPSVTPNP